MTPFGILVAAALQLSAPINPYVREILGTEEVARWTFEQGPNGFVAEHQCSVKADGGVLKIQSTGEDPYLSRPVHLPGGEMALELKMRSRADGSGSIFWTTDRSPRRGPDKEKGFELRHDGQWHDYEVILLAPGTLLHLRLDPGSAPGEVEVASIRLLRRHRHPLSIEAAQANDDRVRFTVKNHGERPLPVNAAGQKQTIAADGVVDVDRPMAKDRPLEAVTLDVAAIDAGKQLPPVRRTVFVHHAGVKGEGIVRPMEGFSLWVARDGSVARIHRGDQLVAVLAPLVLCDGRVPILKITQESPAVRLEGEGVAVTLTPTGREIGVSIVSSRPCEGPVVRAVGPLEQGLLAGVEYLDRGEASSSTLDIENEQHVRFAPDPLHVTMPLMAFVCGEGDRHIFRSETARTMSQSPAYSLALTWRDMHLQPVFATPNFFDGTADHRMALRGTKIDATLGLGGGPLEEAILWAVKKAGLPSLPPEPRSADQQWDLCRKALAGPLRTEAGWGHCVEPRFDRQPYADVASTWWRLNDEVLPLPRLAPGGAHVRNDAIYFVSGRAAEWRDMLQREARGLIARQKPDGSYRYDGPFRRGHYEDTANGVCALPATRLLEHARLTGDAESLAAGVRTLEYMKRFRTPRGAQVWECPLHTPDQLASAYAVWAYVRGYELTGDKTYLAEARRWALTGVPFVYLWSCHPVMLYGTPPVLGATNWQAPVWIGLPVQWVGGVYAYALAALAPHDATLDWRKLARGILIAGEQMQYSDGANAGLLPDSFALAAQQRRPWNINPSALVSLRLVLDGKLDSLAVATDGKRRVVAPFPVAIRDGKIHVDARPGVKYQLLVDGSKVIDVTSQGADVVPLP